MLRRLAAVAVLSTATLACAQPFDFAPWSFTVPEDAEQIGYPRVSSEERRGPPVELIEDLVIGYDGADFNYLFGRTPPRVAAADDGRMVVLDRGNFRVQVFDADGRFLASMGSQGQGPGELGQSIAHLLDGDTVRVWDVVNRRVTSWTLDGELIGSEATAQWGGLIVQVGGGEMVWRQTERYPDRSQDTIFQRVRADGSEVVEYARTPWPLRTIDPPIGEIVGTESDAWWVGTVPPAFAASPEGDVYVSPFDEYQIFAYAPDGAMRWALQVDGERPPISPGEIDYFMEIHARRFPSRSAGLVPWPELQYALADIKVDGHGHIYVFPYVPKDTPADAPRPVDVYSSAGDRLYTGFISGRMFTTAFAMYNGPMLEVAWQVVRGDYVWGLAESADTGDREVVRFRLVEPF